MAGMNILVCLKQVPGTTQVKIDPQTNTLVRQGIESICNPFDTYALEEGIRLRERYGGKVTALSMGPPQAEPMLKEAISIGADEAILLSDSAFAGSDTLATASTLARAVVKIGSCDLIICGRQTLDGDTGQVGPELAEMLGISFVAYVSKVEEVDRDGMRVQRMVEDGHEVMKVELPAVMTVVKEINIPRLPSLRGMVRAKSATIPVWTARELGVAAGEVGMPASATQVIRVFFPQRVSKGEMLPGDAEAQAESLVTRLRESKLI